jgi:CheY-like chemotaxis protein
MKRVLDVGQCAIDHGSLRYLVEDQFEASLAQAHSERDALALLRAEPFDLVLVNRVFDRDGSDGLSLIKAIKADPQLAAVPVMLVSNYPQYQEQATAAGAERGFGKSELLEAQTVERLRKYLG